MFMQTQIFKERPNNPPINAAFQVNLKRGRISYLVGPAGSGKTTLLRILLGSQRPDQGLIAVDGKIWFHRDGSRLIETLDRSVSGMFDDDLLPRHQTVQAIIARALPLWAPPVRARRVAALLERIGMVRLAKRRVLNLSLEQCWRLAMARALAPKPRLLLLDEPFARITPGKVEALEAELQAMVREEGASVLLSDAGDRPQDREGATVLPIHEGRIQRVIIG
jgi:ABC-type sulfate/molybdate transport systems ATPase subunit